MIHISKHGFSVFLTLFVFGMCDAITATFFQDFLRSTFFFDTVFMIAALFIFGPVAAILEYVIFISLICLKLNFLYGSTSHVYFYTLSAFTIVFVTWIFVRKKENLKKGVNHTFLYILTAAILSAIACSIVSGFISYFTFGITGKKWNFDMFIYAFKGKPFSLLESAIIGRIPVTILDRIITTFAGFGIYKLYARIFWRGGNRN